MVAEICADAIEEKIEAGNKHDTPDHDGHRLCKIMDICRYIFYEIFIIDCSARTCDFIDVVVDIPGSVKGIAE